MKGIYFTDTHILGRNPGSRIDDYPKALHRKFREMVSVVQAEKPDFIVHGGDFFHHPTVADSIKNRYIRLLKQMRKTGVTIYLVPGNHDLFGYSMTTIDQTAIGVLASSGIVKLLTRDKRFIVKDDDGLVVALHGREYDKDIDKDPLSDYQIRKSKKAKYNFLFSHGMLLKKPFHPDVRYSLTKDVVTDADIVLNGHYHPGYPLHEESGTLFGNPGSVGRDEASKDSIKRMPQYAVITADKKGYNVEYRAFKCAEKGADVFDRSHIEEKKTHERYLEAFEQTIQDAVTFDSFDTKDLLQKLAATAKLPEKVVNDAFDAIVDKEKVETTNKIAGYTEKKKIIGIKSIELENFQSHKKTKIELDGKGLNAITGASDSGKSAIIRALRWVLYNEPRGTDFIRHGAKRVTATVTFTDGSSITRSRTASSAGEYIVRDKNGKETEFKGFGTNLPIDIANTHQMPKVELSPGVEKSLNFSFQLDGHFLLSDSPSTRASVIGRLTGVHLVDGSIKDRYASIRNETVAINGTEKKIAELDETLQSFTDLDVLEKRINIAKGLIMGADLLEKDIEELRGLVDLYNNETKAAKELQNDLAEYSDLPEIEPLINEAEEIIREYNELSSLRSEMLRYKDEIDEINAELVDYSDLYKVDSKLEEADDLILLLNELNVLLDDYMKAAASEYGINKELKKYEGLQHMPDLDELDASIQELNEMKKLMDEVNSEDVSIAKLEKELKDNRTMTADIESKLDTLIKANGSKCPTCQQEITDTAHMLDHAS